VESFNNLLEPVVLFTKIGILLSLAYYIIQTGFDWRKAGKAAGWLFTLGFGIHYLSDIPTSPHIPDNLSCRAMVREIFLCNGWPVYFREPYQQLEKGIAGISDSGVIRGQAVIATGVFLIVIWTELAKGIMAGAKAVGTAILVGGATLFALFNTGWLVGNINGVTNTLFSLGMLDIEKELQNVDKILIYLNKIIEFRTDLEQIQTNGILDDFWLSVKTHLASFGASLSFFMLYCFSWVNMLLFLLQYILIVFLPSLALFMTLSGSFDPMKLVRFLFYGAILKLFVVAQLGGLSMIDIPVGESEFLNASGELALGVLVATAGVSAVAFFCFCVVGSILTAIFIKEILPVASSMNNMIRSRV
jgi:hypothetical protein